MPRKKKLPSARDQYWIGYSRKSTDSEDKQIYTLQDQAAMIQAYYDRLPPTERARRPLRLLHEAQSAYHPGRPVFQSILQMASCGQVYGVIVVHPNRISRNHSDSGAFVQRLVDRQITCLDTTTGKRYTGADSNDIFMLTLEGAMSWKDSRDKGDRILQAMRMRAAEGKTMGPVRIGYKTVYRPDGTKVLEVVPQTAPFLRQLFQLAAAGTHSLQDLTHQAWAMGLRSRGGRKLAKSAIHTLLRDPLYKGHVRFNGIEAKGVHEPVVDEAVWNRVQQVLTARRKNIDRPKGLTLRELFVFGNLLRCPKCGRMLCPYRAKGRYIYYECKNPETDCGVCVAQATLIEQLPDRLPGVFLSTEELGQLRERLLRRYQHRTGHDVERRSALNEEYEKVQREIGEVFAQRKDAADLGVLDEVDLRLSDLKQTRDELQAQLNRAHQKGTAWIDQVVRAFELVNLLQEAILYGSRQQRETALKAVVSNSSVQAKNLILELRSPFRESAQKHVCPEWWAGLDDVRTEVFETVGLLEKAFSHLQALEVTRTLLRQDVYASP